jgi:hypothetical protein
MFGKINTKTQTATKSAKLVTNMIFKMLSLFRGKNRFCNRNLHEMEQQHFMKNFLTFEKNRSKKK